MRSWSTPSRPTPVTANLSHLLPAGRRGAFRSALGPAEWLIRLRLLLGRLGLDRGTNQLPIPGCSETSVSERLKAEDREPLPARDARLPFRVVYDRDSERLLELSNSTVHALLHLSWAHKTGTLYAPRMAVYVKPRGWFGRLYMALIYPFRVLVVYPAVLRASQRRWESLAQGLEALRRRERSLGSRPLIVLTRGVSPPVQPGVSAETAQRMWVERKALQVELTQLSSNSVQVIAEQSGHAVPRDQPQLVVDATIEVVRAVREGRRVERELVLAGAARARP